MRQAVTVQGTYVGEAALSDLVWTLGTWSGREAVLARLPEARQKLDDAIAVTQKVNRWSPLRSQMDQSLHRQQQFLLVIAAPSRPVFYDLSSWLGTWQIKFDDGRVGKLYLSQNSQTGTAEVRLGGSRGKAC